jgi:hypothetical protein
MSRADILAGLDADALARYAAVVARRPRPRLTEPEALERVLDRLMDDEQVAS